MLQQTRVAAVIPFYQRFLGRFPNLRALAEAAEPDLLAHWAGLGYYHRARNMQKAAQQLQSEGGFPAHYEELRALPGIGDYTAAALASIAFDLPCAAVDGNVLRVLSRVTADATDIGSAAGRKCFTAIANALLDSKQPGTFNQAMMELGATVCLPRNPQCLICPVSFSCRARLSGRQSQFPVKLGRAKSLIEERLLLWIEREGEILVWQRPADARLMPGFWELPERLQLPSAIPGEKLGAFRHGITFHDYRFEICRAETPAETSGCKWVQLESLQRMPVSTILRKAQKIVERGARRSAAAAAI